MASTRVELVDLLIERQKSLRSPSLLLTRLIRSARDGHYHDWDSHLDMPKVQLIKDMSVVKVVDLSNIIARVKDGDFDEEPTPEQLEELRFDVGPDVFDRMMGLPERGKA